MRTSKLSLQMAHNNWLISIILCVMLPLYASCQHIGDATIGYSVVVGVMGISHDSHYAFGFTGQATNTGTRNFSLYHTGGLSFIGVNGKPLFPTQDTSGNCPGVEQTFNETNKCLWDIAIVPGKLNNNEIRVQVDIGWDHLGKWNGYFLVGVGFVSGESNGASLVSAKTIPIHLPVMNTTTNITPSEYSTEKAILVTTLLIILFIRAGYCLTIYLMSRRDCMKVNEYSLRKNIYEYGYEQNILDVCTLVRRVRHALLLTETLLMLSAYFPVLQVAIWTLHKSNVYIFITIFVLLIITAVFKLLMFVCETVGRNMTKNAFPKSAKIVVDGMWSVIITSTTNINSSHVNQNNLSKSLIAYCNKFIALMQVDSRLYHMVHTYCGAASESKIKKDIKEAVVGLITEFVENNKSIERQHLQSLNRIKFTIIHAEWLFLNSNIGTVLKHKNTDSADSAIGDSENMVNNETDLPLYHHHDYMLPETNTRKSKVFWTTLLSTIGLPSAEATVDNTINTALDLIGSPEANEVVTGSQKFLEFLENNRFFIFIIGIMVLVIIILHVLSCRNIHTSAANHWARDKFWGWATIMLSACIIAGLCYSKKFVLAFYSIIVFYFTCKQYRNSITVGNNDTSQFEIHVSKFEELLKINNIEISIRTCCLRPLFVLIFICLTHSFPVLGGFILLIMLIFEVFNVFDLWHKRLPDPT